MTQQQNRLCRIVGVFHAFLMIGFVPAFAFIPIPARPQRHCIVSSSRLFAAPPTSLKPAAEPLMAAGKALAITGEQLIEWTADNSLYGGALSSAGAAVRNAGDSVAQAAASCRFKTGRELVIDELREAGTCMAEAVEKLRQAVEEAGVDEDAALAAEVEKSIEPISTCATALEEAGMVILKGGSVVDVGRRLVRAGQALEQVQWGNDSVSCKRFAQQAVRAGENLQGITPKPTGRSFLKPNSVE